MCGVVRIMRNISHVIPIQIVEPSIKAAFIIQYIVPFTNVIQSHFSKR